jgi:hypothetical protein
MTSRTFNPRTLSIGALAALVATAVVAVSPASAAFRAHGGGGLSSRAGFGGFSSHSAFGGFHHFGPHFRHRFAFAGFGFAPGYDYGDYGYDDGCWRRVRGPYGWRVINVCD